MSFAGTKRFELIKHLGEGGFGVVYEAFDRKRSTRVALKVLREGEGAALYRFKREFRALADVSHPNLVALDELLTDGSHWFFTMELVRGVPVVAYVRPSDSGESHDATRGRLDEKRLRSSFAQLADALNTIHSRGIVHRDIKPSNVLVTADGRVVVLDFGLVAERPVSEPDDDPSVVVSGADLVVLGTPAYMAPEQATPDPVTPAADWYSVGVVLYQALTGRLPFAGTSIDVLDAKQWDTPTPPNDLAPDAPRDLAALSMKLMNADPTRRPSGEAILRSLNGGSARPGIDAATRPVPETLVGRESHLAVLGEAFEASRSGKTVIAFVSGLSGMGKTALIRHFLHQERAKDAELLALTSRCYERESMPYKAIDPLVDALARHLKRLHNIEVARVLPRDTAILARVFPVLLQIPEVHRAPMRHSGTLDSFALRERAAEALRHLLDALSSQAPLILAIDDVQWGDADSASILQRVLRPPDAPRLLLIAAYRSDDSDGTRLVSMLRSSIPDDSESQVCDIEVGSLSTSEARQLADSLTSGRPDAVERAQAIALESGGNAFFVHELAQHAASVGGSTRLEAVVLDRVRALPEPARRLVVAVALSAQSIPADVAAMAAELAADDRESLQMLRASRLVRTRVRSEEPAIEAYHDRIRESVVSQLRGTVLESWHRRLASAWQRSPQARPETLVTHYQGAGDIAKTSEYARVAAGNAEAALAFDRAAGFYELLVRLETDAARRRDWYTRLGEALVNAGQGHDAAAAFLKAIDDPTGDTAIELERRAASELIRAGYLDEASVVLDRLLPKVGVRAPGSDLRSLVTLLGYRLLLSIRGTRFRERAESEVPRDVLRRIDVLTSISEPLCLTSLVRGQALNVQGAWHALRAGEPRRAVRGLTGLVASSSVAGTRADRRTGRLLDAARTQATHMQDAWTIGRTTLAEGFALKLSGQWQHGVERLERAIKIFSECHGVRWEVETAQTLIHDSLLWMGEWNRLSDELPARRQAAEQRGDLFAAAYVTARMSPVLHLAADRIEQARAEVAASLTRWTKRVFNLQHRFAVCTWIDIDLYAGEPASAADRLAAAWPALRIILLGYQFGRIEMVFYRARIALALSARGDAVALRRAESDGERLAKEGAPWASALAQLIRATVAHGRGQTRAATTKLEEAEVKLRECRMSHYAAAAQYRLGNLIGGDGGRARAAAATQWMRDRQKMINPARMADLLAPGPW